MVELAEMRRDSGFELLYQVKRELTERTVPSANILSEMKKFEFEWEAGETLQVLGSRYRFKKVHDAECERRGILLYEIYAQRGKYRAVVAWFEPDGPGCWVSVFKKQGDAQSRSSLRTAGERALIRWRQMYG